MSVFSDLTKMVLLIMMGSHSVNGPNAYEGSLLTPVNKNKHAVRVCPKLPMFVGIADGGGIR